MTRGHQRAVALLDNAISEAVRQCKLAYEFSANSYTITSLNACLAAKNAHEVIREHLSDETSKVRGSGANRRSDERLVDGR